MDETPSAEPPAPGLKTSVYCSNCEEDVEPAGKGVCPVCKRFLPENVVALTHGGRRMKPQKEYESRRVALRAEVWADLGGTVPPIIAEVAEDFVSACVLRDQLVEHLEAIGPLTTRGTRRAAMDLYLATSARIERLSAMLGAFKDGAPTPAQTPTQSETRDELFARVAQLNELVAHLHANEEMAAEMREELTPEPADTPGDAGPAREVTTPTPAPAPAPTCGYGCGTLERCTELKATRPDAWAALHFLDPEEVKKRDEHATKVMLKMMPFGNPY